MPYSPFKGEVLEPVAGEGSLQRRPWPKRETGILGTESNIHPTSGTKSLLTRLSGTLPFPTPNRHAGKDGTFRVVLEPMPLSFLRSQR